MKVRSAFDAEVTVATYAFFADDRRASRTVTNRGGRSGVTYHFYDGHEVIEERDGSGAVVQQYLFGPQHIDELLLTLGENGANWVHQDANWNVIGTTTSTGQVAERYTYDPYGRLRARRLTGFGDTDADGLVGTKDVADWEDTQGEHGVYDRKLDANLDGVNDAYDAAAFDKMVSLPGGRLTVPNRRFSPSEQWAGYTARTLDPESGLMHYRLRAYSPELRRFGQRDPLGYVDGVNLYGYTRSNPYTGVDPFGEQVRGTDTDRELYDEWRRKRRPADSDDSAFWDWVTTWLPIFSDARDVCELKTGRDLFTGERRPGDERIIGAGGLLIGSGHHWIGIYRPLKRAGGWVWGKLKEGASSVGKGLKKLKKRFSGGGRGRGVGGGGGGGGTAGAPAPPPTPPAAPTPPPRVNKQKQRQHDPNSKHYVPPKSTLTADPEELFRLCQGKGSFVNSAKTRCSHPNGAIIGEYIDPVTGKATPTSNYMVVMRADGSYHIYPLRP